MCQNEQVRFLVHLERSAGKLNSRYTHTPSMLAFLPFSEAIMVGDYQLAKTRGNGVTKLLLIIIVIEQSAGHGKEAQLAADIGNARCQYQRVDDDSRHG